MPLAYSPPSKVLERVLRVVLSRLKNCTFDMILEHNGAWSFKLANHLISYVEDEHVLFIGCVGSRTYTKANNLHRVLDELVAGTQMGSHIVLLSDVDLVIPDTDEQLMRLRHWHLQQQQLLSHLTIRRDQVSFSLRLHGFVLRHTYGGQSIIFNDHSHFDGLSEFDDLYQAWQAFLAFCLEK